MWGTHLKYEGIYWYSLYSTRNRIHTGPGWILLFLELDHIYVLRCKHRELNLKISFCTHTSVPIFFSISLDTGCHPSMKVQVLY